MVKRTSGTPSEGACRLPSSLKSNTPRSMAASCSATSPPSSWTPSVLCCSCAEEGFEIRDEMEYSRVYVNKSSFENLEYEGVGSRPITTLYFCSNNGDRVWDLAPSNTPWKISQHCLSLYRIFKNNMQATDSCTDQIATCAAPPSAR